jgi:hypothetical protein
MNPTKQYVSQYVRECVSDLYMFVTLYTRTIKKIHDLESCQNRHDVIGSCGILGARPFMHKQTSSCQSACFRV